MGSESIMGMIRFTSELYCQSSCLPFSSKQTKKHEQLWEAVNRWSGVSESRFY